MDASFKLYILSSNGPEVDVDAVNIYKDDKDKNGYAIINNKNISLDILEVFHLRGYVCSIKGVGNSDKNNLKLWKVIGIKSKDIKEQNISTEEDIVQKLRGKEMELEEPFSTYFQDELDNKNKSGSSIITIIPATEQPGATVLPTKSIEDAINEAESLFNQNSQDLVNVATNAYEPYSYFKASEKNSCKKFIDDKKIPVVNKEPNLLIHNLPEQGEKGLTDYDSLKKHIEENIARSNKTVVLGTSGCGKTRLCFEALCHNYGLYLVALPYSVGSVDLEESARWVRDKIKDKQPQEAERIAEQAVMSCIVGRLFLLKHLFIVAEQHNTIMAPKSWLILQLNHIIIRELYIIFRDVKDLNSFCEILMKDIKNKLTKIFPIVYDEAQSHTTYLPETFPSAQLKKDRARPFFSIVVRTLSILSNSFIGAFICITGSGLSLLRAKDEISTRAKEETHIPTFNQFGQIETSDELLKLAMRIIPLEDKHVLSAIKWLKGRYRWSWTWIHYLIKSEHFDPEKQLNELVTILTTSADNLPRREYSIYTGFVDLQKYPSERPPYVKNVSTLELMKRAIAFYSMTGEPIMLTSTIEKDIMNLGFAHIKDFHHGCKSIIDEPLVIQAGFNYFESYLNDIWFQMMSQIKFNAAMPGLIWEKCVVNFLRKSLFESNKPLSENEMWKVKTKFRKREIIIDYNYLPDDFKRPPQLLPYGDKCTGQTAVESTSANNYLKWLKAVARWEKTGKVPTDFCPICYPPNTAGPDISIAFYFPDEGDDMPLDEEDDMLLDEEEMQEEMQEDMLLDEEEDDDKRKERKSYILNVQVKLRKRAVIKQSFNTVEPKKMFMNKNQKSNPLGDNIKLNKIYKEQDWYDRNIKMIVVYPCDSTKKREHQQTSGASKRKRAIPRVIIGTENASVLFPKDCQEWIRDFKEKGPEDWDCSDIEESDDD